MIFLIVTEQASHKARHFWNTLVDSSGKRVTDRQGDPSYRAQVFLCILSLWLVETRGFVSHSERFYMLVKGMLGSDTEVGREWLSRSLKMPRQIVTMLWTCNVTASAQPLTFWAANQPCRTASIRCGSFQELLFMVHSLTHFSPIKSLPAHRISP